MTNNEIRNLIAFEAELRIGNTRFELDYKCEETCAEGVTDVLNTVSRSGEGFNVGSCSCNDMYANMSKSPYWYEPDDYMIRGDIIFFDWDILNDSRPLDHVGIVLSVNDDVFSYANINGSSHNTWTIQTMRKDSCNIAYWLRYINPTPETNAMNMDENSKALELRMTIEKCKNVLNELLILLND